MIRRSSRRETRTQVQKFLPAFYREDYRCAVFSFDFKRHHNFVDFFYTEVSTRCDLHLGTVVIVSDRGIHEH